MTNDKIKAPSSGRFFLFEPHLYIPVLIMAITAILFNRYDWDLRVQSYYYQDGWHQSDLWWVQLLYRHGNIPAIIVSAGALLLLIKSYFKKSGLVKYHKIAIFLSLAMVLGPGIIVNSIFKDNWGRPRPRDLEIYGGRYSYEAPLTMDRESDGKSFPCGHATMGFYFFAPAFGLGLKKRYWYYLLSIFAALYGSWIGWGRIIQGGHFLSDVIFAGAMVYLSTWGLWRVMRMHKSPFYEGKLSKIHIKPWQIALIVLGVIIIILGVSLATPYTTQQNFNVPDEDATHLYIGLDRGNVSLSFSDSSYISNEVYGFGFPGSRARLGRSINDGKYVFQQHMKGYFTEFIAEIAVVVDSLNLQSFTLDLRDGDLYLDADESILDRLDINESVPVKAIEPANTLDAQSGFRVTAPRIIRD